MSDDQSNQQEPISVVRFGLGKELQLFEDALVITSQEEGKAKQYFLDEIQKLSLTPGEHIRSKLVLSAVLTDGSRDVLTDGLSNVRDFREMIPKIRELQPDIQFEPTNIEEQLWQALNNKRAWSITCYGAIALLCVSLYALYQVISLLQHH